MAYGCVQMMLHDTGVERLCKRALVIRHQHVARQTKRITTSAGLYPRQAADDLSQTLAAIDSSSMTLAATLDLDNYSNCLVENCSYVEDAIHTLKASE